MSDLEDTYSELRTDWLKLRGCLVDPNTDLPSLPMVLDEVRRRLENGARIALLYLDPSCGGHLEATHGWQAYDERLRQLATACLACRRDGEPLALVGVRSDEFVLFPAVDGGSEDLEGARSRFLSDLERHLRGASEGHAWPPVDSAVVELAIEPTVRIERSIYQGLERARQLCRQEGERRYSGRLVELGRILAEHDVVVRYQPIVDLTTGRLHGLEALSSARASSLFTSPDTLFAFAEQSRRIVELDRLCRREAMRRAGPLIRSKGTVCGVRLFLNCSAHIFEEEALLEELRSGAQSAEIDPGCVVLEITERVAITEWHSFRESLLGLKQAGFRVAIDDMGSGYSSLRAVAEIEPDYLKFDLSLVSGIDTSAIKRELLETLVTLARKIGALAIAEGIEQPRELETLRSMGVEFGQGFHLAHPSLPEDLEKLRFEGLGNGQTRLRFS